MAQWSERSPFISEVAGSILSENVLNVTRTQCSIHVKKVSQHSAESRGFSPGAPVSSHRKMSPLHFPDISRVTESHCEGECNYVVLCYTSCYNRKV